MMMRLENVTRRRCGIPAWLVLLALVALIAFNAWNCLALQRIERRASEPPTVSSYGELPSAGDSARVFLAELSDAFHTKGGWVWLVLRAGRVTHIEAGKGRRQQ